MRRILRTATLQLNVIPHFDCGKPLSMTLKKSKPIPCPSNCYCNNRNMCSSKNLVYHMQCNICDKISYVGETMTMLHTRIKRHLADENSEINRHLRLTHQFADIGRELYCRTFKTTILESNFPDTTTRKFSEAAYIDKLTPSLNIQLMERIHH